MKKGIEIEDESLPYINGVGSLHQVSEKPGKKKDQIGFIRNERKPIKRTQRTDRVDKKAPRSR